MCNEDLPALFYNRYDNLTNIQLIRGSEEQDQKCNELFKKTTGASKDNWYYISYDTTTEISESASSPCDTPCTSPETSQQYLCPTLSCSNTAINKKCYAFSVTSKSGCYCEQTLKKNINEYGYISGAKRTLDEDNNYCYNFAYSYLMSFIFSMGTSLFTLILNSVMMNVLGCITKIERRRNKSSEIRSTAMKIFISLFVNTAIIILIVQSNGISGKNLGLDKVGIFGGNYEDFSSAWYEGVGSSILKTMILNMITAHIWPVLSYFIILPLQRCCGKKAVLQDELNQLYEGEDFILVQRLPLIFNTIFVSYFYTSGMPIFCIIAACSFFILFWVDKACFLRMYKKPPNYGAELITDSLSILPLAIVLHLAVSIWMYGSNDIFYDSSTGEGLINLKFLSDQTGLDYTQIQELYDEWINDNKFDYFKILPKVFFYYNIIDC